MAGLEVVMRRWTLLGLAVTAGGCDRPDQEGVGTGTADGERATGVCPHDVVSVPPGSNPTVSWEHLTVTLTGAPVTLPEGEDASVRLITYDLPLAEVLDKCAADDWADTPSAKVISPSPESGYETYLPDTFLPEEGDGARLILERMDTTYERLAELILTVDASSTSTTIVFP